MVLRPPGTGDWTMQAGVEPVITLGQVVLLQVLVRGLILILVIFSFSLKSEILHLNALFSLKNHNFMHLVILPGNGYI